MPTEAFGMEHVAANNNLHHQHHHSAEQQQQQQAGTAKAQVIAERFKTKLCRNWVQTKECPYEQRCMFAHGDHEIRTKEMNLRDGLTTEDAVKQFQRRLRNSTVATAAAAAAVTSAAPTASPAMSSSSPQQHHHSANRPHHNNPYDGYVPFPSAAVMQQGANMVDPTYAGMMHQHQQQGFGYPANAMNHPGFFGGPSAFPMLPYPTEAMPTVCVEAKPFGLPEELCPRTPLLEKKSAAGPTTTSRFDTAAVQEIPAPAAASKKFSSDIVDAFASVQAP